MPIWFHAMETEIRYLPPGVPELSRFFSVKGWSGLKYRSDTCRFSVIRLIPWAYTKQVTKSILQTVFFFFFFSP